VSASPSYGVAHLAEIVHLDRHVSHLQHPQGGKRHVPLCLPSRRYFGPQRIRVTSFSLIKRRVPGWPHWYLAVIGSDPSVRGKGFAHALMTSRLDRVDAEHAPAYLESTKRANVPYYQRFGFEVTGEIVLPDGGPTMWPMWRTAR
jgi:GNAT superfamily N-acetyltransferase